MAEKELCQKHSGFESDIKTLKDENKKQWDAIDKLRNRPPVWCTIMFMVFTFLLGFTLNISQALHMFK